MNTMGEGGREGGRYVGFGLQPTNYTHTAARQPKLDLAYVALFYAPQL